MTSRIHKSIVIGMIAGVFGAKILAGGSIEVAKKFYNDDPLWSMPRPVPVESVGSRKLNEYYDFFQNTLFPPGARVQHHGQYLPSQGINTVDEVPDSEWYTNRHAMRRMSLEELMAG